MAVYCVSYDLNKQGQNYNALYEELRKTEFLHILGSTWLISTSEAPTEISNRLRQKMDANDYIFISKVNMYEKDGWLPKVSWEWINARV